jgi:NADPH:quinone reductase-like Zn-dependent oxidoreductase
MALRDARRGGDGGVQRSLTSLFTRQKLKTFIVSPSRADLLSLKEIVEAGKAKPFIERRYALSEVANALRHVGGGHARGQVVIRIADC